MKLKELNLSSTESENSCTVSEISENAAEFIPTKLPKMEYVTDQE